MLDDGIVKIAAIVMIFFLLPLFASCAYALSSGSSLSLKKPLQAIVVIAGNWDSATAILQRYERNRQETSWQAVGERLTVAIGRKGLAWGTGLHTTFPSGEPTKKEGDGKAPAGVFRLSIAFGYAKPDAMTWVRLPYRQATANLLCIDDASSAYYNHLIDATRVKSDWNSYEDLLRKDDQYRLGIVIEHNTDPAVPGSGSCIFMHIWAGPGIGTSGCTAMAAKDLELLLRWLDPEAHPILIQLPDAAYNRYRQDWQLP